jgi:hypothetical protein
MRLSWIVVTIVGASALAGATPRTGKVVRVVRRAPGITGHPRFCAVHPGDMFGHCIGSKAPEVGERMVAVDYNHVLGVIRVTNVDPYNDGCQQTNQWMIQTVVETGDVRSARGQMLTLADVPVDARNAKLVTVDKTPMGHTWGTDTIYAVDNNADGNVDLEFIQYPCDDLGNATLGATTSQCHEVWANQPGRGLERLRQDRFRVCY